MNVLNIKSERSRKIYNNIVLSLIVKGGSVITSILIIPLTIQYIDPLRYGIWLTISSMVTWMSVFDIGLASGLRNKLSWSLAMDEIEKSKEYISTAYLSIIVIATILFGAYILVSPAITWRELMNIPPTVSDDIEALMTIVVGAFCLQLILQIVNSVLTAYHEPATAGLILFIGQSLSLLILYILKATIPGNLTLLTVIMLVVPIVTLMLSSLFLYNSKLKDVSPSFKNVNLKYTKDLIGLGSTFFFMQIGGLVLLYTNNIVILKILGPESVTKFNVAYRLYFAISIIFHVVVNPYWSAFTDAYAKADFNWMKRSLRTLRIIWMILAFVVIPIVYMISDTLFYLWIGSSVSISKSLSMAMAMYTIGYSLLTLNSFLLNGTGKLRIQLILYCIVCVVNIPISILFCRRFGLEGITYSSVLIFLILGVVMWIQNTKIVEKKARGIWDK